MVLTKRLDGVAGALALVVLLPAAAHADFTALTSAGQIDAPPYTFDSLPEGFVTSATNTLTAPEGFTIVSPSNGEIIVAVTSNQHVLDVSGSVRFRFENLVEAAGVEYETSTMLSLIAYDDFGIPINPDGSVTGPAFTAGFFGVSSDAGIRELLIHDTAFTFRLDNLRFGAAAIGTPIPAAWMLGALGLGLAGVVRRRF